MLYKRLHIYIVTSDHLQYPRVTTNKEEAEQKET